MYPDSYEILKVNEENGNKFHSASEMMLKTLDLQMLVIVVSRRGLL